MDVTTIVLSISLGSLCTITSTVIAILGYKLNVKKKQEADLQQKLKLAREDQASDDGIKMQLLSIEKDVQYIRMSVDKVDKRLDDHDKRIRKLESHKSFKKEA